MSSEIDLFNIALESQYLVVESSQAEFDTDSEIYSNEQSAQTMAYDISTNSSHENLEFVTNSVKKKKINITGEDLLQRISNNLHMIDFFYKDTKHLKRLILRQNPHITPCELVDIIENFRKTNA